MTLARAEVEPLRADSFEPGWFDAVYAEDPNYWLAVDMMLMLMLRAGLPLPKQRLADLMMVTQEGAPPIMDPEALGIYVVDLKAAGITMDDIAADGHEVRRRLQWFPSSAELTAAMVALKGKRCPSHLIVAPVYIYEEGRGVCVTDKAQAIRAGIPYWATGMDAEIANGLRPPMRELPEGEERRTVSELLANVTRSLMMRNRVDEPLESQVKRLKQANKEKMREVEEELKVLAARRKKQAKGRRADGTV